MATPLRHRNLSTTVEGMRGITLARRMSLEPGIPLLDTLDIVAEVCVGLEFAHEHGVVDVAVNPHRIWLGDDGAVKLLVGDGGISDEASTAFDASRYRSPEQLTTRRIDERSVLFSAGIVLYELLARRHPFAGTSEGACADRIVHADPEPIASRVADLPKELIDAVAAALHKNPDDRYQLAGELAADLQLIRLSLQRGDDAPAIVSVWDDEELEPALDVPHDLAARRATRGTRRRRWRLVLWPIAAATTAAFLVGAVVWRSTNEPIALPTAPQPIRVATVALEIPEPPLPADDASASTAEPLPPSPALVKVVAWGSYPFAVVDGGKVVASAAMNHVVWVPVRHTIRLVADELLLDRAVPIDPPGARTFSVAAPEPGRLDVRVPASLEACTVMANGRSLGSTSSASRPIAPGSYAIQLRCADGHLVPGPTVTVVAGAVPTTADFR